MRGEGDWRTYDNHPLSKWPPKWHMVIPRWYPPPPLWQSRWRPQNIILKGQQPRWWPKMDGLFYPNVLKSDNITRFLTQVFFHDFNTSGSLFICWSIFANGLEFAEIIACAKYFAVSLIPRIPQWQWQVNYTTYFRVEHVHEKKSCSKILQHANQGPR